MTGNLNGPWVYISHVVPCVNYINQIASIGGSGEKGTKRSANWASLIVGVGSTAVQDPLNLRDVIAGDSEHQSGTRSRGEDLVPGRYTGNHRPRSSASPGLRERNVIYPTMLLLRPLRRTANENKNGLRNGGPHSPSSNRLSTAIQSLPIPLLYASRTAKNIGSESGCVDANARSST